MSYDETYNQLSKQLGARVTCGSCGHVFDAKFYRSLWIEDLKNRDLVFSDEVNVIVCPVCKVRERPELPLLCTNVKKGFAVWYEPSPHPDVEADAREYAKHFGSTSFYATAPRLRTWAEVKQHILQFESEGAKAPQMSVSPEMAAQMRGFLDHVKTQGGKRGPHWWRALGRPVRTWVVGGLVWAIGVPVFAYAFNSYGSSMSDDELAHMWFLMLVPPLFVGAVVIAWNRYVRWR